MNWKRVAWVLVTLGALSLTYAEARRLFPTTKEIIVREVANGYLVEARTLNSLYPYQEYVFTDPAMAGSAVAGLLGERIPTPRWGR